jgi:hypothetical protein
MFWFHITFVKDHKSNQDINSTFNRFEAEWLKPVFFSYIQIGTKDVRCDVKGSAMLMRVLGDSICSR